MLTGTNSEPHPNTAYSPTSQRQIKIPISVYRDQKSIGAPYVVRDTKVTRLMVAVNKNLKRARKRPSCPQIAL